MALLSPASQEEEGKLVKYFFFCVPKVLFKSYTSAKEYLHWSPFETIV